MGHHPDRCRSSAASLGELIGLHDTIWVCAIGGGFAFVPVALSSVRSIGEMPDPVGESEKAAEAVIAAVEAEAAAS